ncbi:MAG: exodeoxyribonuclease VII small subunit [Anaerolineales bacterium]
MSPTKPKTKLDQPTVEELSYEQALAELEEIVASLEANKLPLDESMALFERGQALTRHCVELLDKAELRVKQLSGDMLEDINTDDQ